jgi:predicted small lipoprotein YifL
MLTIAAVFALLALAGCGSNDNLKFPGKVSTPTPASTATPTETPAV